MARGRAAARIPRVPARIVIPDLTGTILRAAQQRALEIGFTLVVAEPTLPTEVLLDSARWTVAEQDPVGGSARFRGDTVVINLRHDGGGDPSGDREPRHPLPRRRADRALSPGDLDRLRGDEPFIGQVRPIESAQSYQLRGDRD